MGQSGSKDREIFVHMPKAMLRACGSTVHSLQLESLLAFVQDTYPWFPEEETIGTVLHPSWASGLSCRNICFMEFSKGKFGSFPRGNLFT